MKSGFVGIIGRSNVGKSTLVNALIGSKVSIVSPKKQTTRNNIRAILNGDDFQIVLVDTPGIHKPKHLLGNYLNQAAYNTLQNVDLIYYVVDAADDISNGDYFLFDHLRKVKVPIFLILNKIDLLSKQQLFEKIEKWSKMINFTELIPISALHSRYVDTLIQQTLRYLPEDIAYFPFDQITDRDDKFIISEYIREKILFHTEEEVPHSTAVIIEMIRRKKNVLVIDGLVLVERPSQKSIIIGKGGQKIKQIASELRKDLEIIYNCKVYITIYVKVEKDWRSKINKIRGMGYIEE